MSTQKVVSLAARRELNSVTSLMTKGVMGSSVQVKPAEYVSLGSLRIDIHQLGWESWFNLETKYLVKATEMVDIGVAIEMELHGDDEVRKAMEFCRKSAEARYLTFYVRTCPKGMAEIFGIQPDELQPATI